MISQYLKYAFLQKEICGWKNVKRNNHYVFSRVDVDWLVVSDSFISSAEIENVIISDIVRSIVEINSYKIFLCLYSKESPTGAELWKKIWFVKLLLVFFVILAKLIIEILNYKKKKQLAGEKQFLNIVVTEIWNKFKKY